MKSFYRIHGLEVWGEEEGGPRIPERWRPPPPNSSSPRQSMLALLECMESPPESVVVEEEEVEAQSPLSLHSCPE